MFDYLGRFLVRRPRLIVACWVSLAVGLTIVAPPCRNAGADDDLRFFPPDMPTVRGFELLREAFPADTEAARLLIVLERPDRPLSAADRELVGRLVARLRELQQREPALKIVGTTGFRDGPAGPRLLSKDGQCTLVIVSLATPYLAVRTQETVDRVGSEVRSLLAEAGLEPPRVYLSGPAGIGRDLLTAGGASLDHTTYATIGLVLLVLLIVYRSPLLALIPLLTIGLSVWVTMQVLALLTLLPGVQVLNTSRVFAVVILFGAGTDYCLFLISRWREELAQGGTVPNGLCRALQGVGSALVAGAGTVIIGLGMMAFAAFGKIRCAGPVLGVGLLITLIAALTLTPALLRLVGVHGVRPNRRRIGQEQAHGPSPWERLAAFVVRRPAWVLSATLIVLIPPAILGLHVEPSYNPTGDLAPTSESVRGLAAIRRHFNPGETGPTTVLLVAAQPWNTAVGEAALAEVARAIGTLPKIAEVRSLTQPLGPEYPRLPPRAKHAGRFELGRRLHGVLERTRTDAEKHYLATLQGPTGTRYVARLEVVFAGDPFEPSAEETLGRLEQILRADAPTLCAGVELQCGECTGVSVQARDLAKLIARDRLVVNSLVTLGVFLVLVLLVRRIWLAGWLLGTVLLSYFVTLGLTAWFAAWLTGRPFGLIEWRVPFFLFIILVAIGEDYNILLVSRILQERRVLGGEAGIRRGLAATGGSITACGLIMAGTFGTLLLADLSTLRQIGFALSVGVLLDTFVIRTFMVPAALALVWNRDRTIDPPQSTIIALPKIMIPELPTVLRARCAWPVRHGKHPQ